MLFLDQFRDLKNKITFFDKKLIENLWEKKFIWDLNFVYEKPELAIIIGGLFCYLLPETTDKVKISYIYNYILW